LLRLADNYLTNNDRAAAEAQFKPFIDNPKQFISTRRRWENNLVFWAEQLSLKRSKNFESNATNESSSASQSKLDENKILAAAAMRNALIQLDGMSNVFARLNLYFIASALLQRAGNLAEARRCDNVLEEAFRSCERSPVDEDDMMAASSILDSMAYGLIPIDVPDFKELRGIKTVHYTEDDFKESEKFKLRAIAMIDHRLSSTSHLRRKAHRDLSLWYAELGKTEKAEKEKEVLFGLVGIHDDDILYPKSAGCGQLTWWVQEKFTGGMLCGMG
jgi:hypothetical protein